MPTYACVEKNIPEDWARLQVIDLETNRVTKDLIVEINTKEGWAVRCKVHAGVGGSYRTQETERITGRWRLEYQPGLEPPDYRSSGS